MSNEVELLLKAKKRDESKTQTKGGADFLRVDNPEFSLLLSSILKELKKINIHLAKISDEEIED